MRDQNTFSNSEASIAPQTGPYKTLPIIISILVTAVIVGFFVYFIMAQLSNNKQANLEQQVKELEQQINSLENNVLLPEQDQAYHDVKYYFDNIEIFSRNTPLKEIETQVVVIRGRLIEEEHVVQCVKSPCLSPKYFYLQDISDENFKIFIYDVNDVAKQLKLDESYIIKGVLKKNLRMTVPFERCNKDLCKFEISLFQPSEVIKDSTTPSEIEINDKSCNSDSDCVIVATGVSLNSCCTTSNEEAINKQAEIRRNEWYAENCEKAVCAMYDCYKDKLPKPRCVNNLCEIEWVVRLNNVR